MHSLLRLTIKCTKFSFGRKSSTLGAVCQEGGKRKGGKEEEQAGDKKRRKKGRKVGRGGKRDGKAFP